MRQLFVIFFILFSLNASSFGFKFNLFKLAPTVLAPIDIAIDSSNTYVLTNKKELYVMGSNFRGQLGNGFNSANTAYILSPTKNTSGISFNKISKASASICINNNGTPYCWGYNNLGQLGNSTNVDSYSPISITTTGNFLNKTSKEVYVSTAAAYSCSINTDETILCWGSNNYGQLGNGNQTSSTFPVFMNKTAGALANVKIQSLSLGLNHACALGMDNNDLTTNVYCWGMNTKGQLGDGTITTGKLNPVKVIGLPGNIQKIVAGYDSSCALTTDGFLYCWGANSSGQVGKGAISTAEAIPINILSNVSDFDVGVGNYACAITTNNGMYCWGSNNFYQLGDGTTITKNLPTQVLSNGVISGLTAKKVKVGSYTTCAIMSDNNIYCWGYNGYGQFGNGSTTNSNATTLFYKMNSLN